jgi:membrane-bound serine protease (ClpP class)
MDIAQALWQLIVNPNVAYLLLIIGLWAAITAFIVPGTGLAEAVAAVALVLGVTGLAQLPVNFVGVAMIALAFVLFLLEFKIITHGALMAGGIASFAFGSVLLVKPTASQPGVSLVVVGATSLATLVFFTVAIRAALRTYRLPIFSSPQHRLVGAHGVVKQALAPLGSVQVKSELWSAVADEPVPAGEEVVVTRIEGLKIHVARAK